MYPKENRLAKTRDFNLLLKHGRWVSSSFLTVKWVFLPKIAQFFPKKEDPEKFKNQLKLAVTVGLKISKSAVRRNRVKRQIREVVRLLLKDKRLVSGYYLIIVAKPSALEPDYAKLSQETDLLLKKIGVLRNS